MTVIMPVLGVLAVIIVAGLRYLARVIEQGRDIVWHPGDEPPSVPGNAPLRTWMQRDD